MTKSPQLRTDRSIWQHTVILFVFVMLSEMLLVPTRCASQTTGTVQQAADQDCEKIKQDIEQLQQDLANLSAEMQRLTEQLDQLNRDVAQNQEHLRASAAANSPWLNETIRGEELDSLAKLLSLRKLVRQQLEDDALTIQAIKEEIADLLTKLANCGPPSTTEPPQREPPNPQPPPSSPPQENKKVALQFRGFGGATFVNGNAPGTVGFDGAVLFPLGNRVLVGPTAGFQWVDSSIVKTIGGGPPPSTFINTSVGFKSGNFGGRIGFPFGGWEIGLRGGATVAGSTITQAEGFCGTSSSSSTVTCTVTSTTTTHDTVVGTFVGGYISHSIFSHVGIFVEGDYRRLKDGRVYDVTAGDIIAGLVLSFGRHQ